MEAFEREVYRVYVSDALYLYGNNKRPGKRWYDIMHPAPEDTRTGDEIAADVITRVGLKVVE